MTDHPIASAIPTCETLLHVGPPKTGSTTIQGAFHDQRDLLVDSVRFLSDDGRAHAILRDLRLNDGGGPWRTAMDARAAHDWPDVRDWISNEDFAAAEDEIAERLLADLGPDRTHVVYVVRPLERILPSQWQQRVRRSVDAPAYDDWLRIVLGDDDQDPHHQHFWARHALAGQAAKWTRNRSPELLRFVIAREGDRSHIFRVFESLMDLPAGRLVAAGSRNSSLTLSQSEFLRSLDTHALRSGMDPERYGRSVKIRLVRYLRELPRDPHDDAILLPRWAAARVREIDEQRVAFLRQTKAAVVGDPQWLLDVEPRLRADGEQPPARIGVDAAAQLLLWSLDREDRAHRRFDAVKVRIESVKAKAEAKAHKAERRAATLRKKYDKYRRTHPDVVPGTELDGVSGRRLARELGARLLRRR